MEKALREFGYETFRQRFSFPYTETLEQRLLLADGTRVGVVATGYSPSLPRGGSTARLGLLRDSDGDVAGRIALARRRGTLDEQENTAAQAGAVALLVVNDTDEELHGWLAPTGGARVPVAGVTRAAGEVLRAEERAGRPVRLTLRTRNERRTTENLIASGRDGDPNHTVLSGAHLDSVPGSPGANDNAAAAAVLLESARALSRRTGPAPRNRLGFAFWSAEEFGMLGSRHYVDHLTGADRERVEMYLNLEMIGSPNHGFFVLDSGAVDPVSGQRPAPGSEEIERRFAEGFTAHGTESRPAPADGRSDYVPFITAGVPTGGLYAGSFERKTPEQARIWGGTAGVAHDPAYHGPDDRARHCGSVAVDTHGRVFHRVLTHYRWAGLSARTAAGVRHD